MPAKTWYCALRFALVVSFFCESAHAEDWPQWRGPNRDDVSSETGLLQEWPQGGPERKWLFEEAGAGYSGVAVGQDTVFTMGTRDEQTILLALKTKNGKERWATPISNALANGWGNGPRGTPTVDGDRVYALSGEGDLVCVKSRDGSIIWKKSLTNDFGGHKPKWGYSESVLVDGNKLLCTPGGDDGAIIALNKLTGETLWTAIDIVDGAQYASIIPVEVDGERQYVQLFMKRVVGVAASDGKLLWEAPFDGQVAVIPTPIYRDKRVYVCAGYGVGCKLFQLDSEEPVEVYANKTMKNHHGGVILIGDRLFGHSDNVGWVCQDFESGNKLWNERNKLGKGAISYADGKLYCVDEQDGIVCLVDATDDGWQEHGRFTLSPLSENRSPRGGIWTHPVIANGKLYLRDQEFIYCFNVAADD